MSSVYVVSECYDYEASYVVGVFANLADAETFAQRQAHGDYYTVEEFVVLESLDAPEGGLAPLVLADG